MAKSSTTIQLKNGKTTACGFKEPSYDEFQALLESISPTTQSDRKVRLAAHRQAFSDLVYVTGMTVDELFSGATNREVQRVFHEAMAFNQYDGDEDEKKSE